MPITKCSSNKGFSGNSSILLRIKFVLADSFLARNPLLLLHSTVSSKPKKESIDITEYYVTYPFRNRN